MKRELVEFRKNFLDLILSGHGLISYLIKLLSELLDGGLNEQHSLRTRLTGSSVLATLIGKQAVIVSSLRKPL